MISSIKRLFRDKNFLKYFKNTFWLFAEKILRMIVSLFIGIWIIRYLGPERFGLFSYVQSFTGLFLAFAPLGLDALLLKSCLYIKFLKKFLLQFF